ncbi:SspB-related isopeptide-forming adhesin, partial [Streptococcus canis]
ANGDDVTNLLEMRHVLSQDTLDDKLKALIKASGISPVGEFYMWVAKDPAA